ncbi:LCP family protein [Actinopolymorpha alba]|uniref:LCP family protein n=1 Tax=Actinopolymorpha alba TaxID=533267 RepID=UPI00037F08E9|nr:LCP family protein [Actinopolymorpha alba]
MRADTEIGTTVQESLSRVSPPTRSFPKTIALTIVGTIIPGLGLLVARRRRLGAAALLAFLLLLAGTAYLAIAGRRMALRWAVQPDALLLIAVFFALLALGWFVVIVTTYRSLRPRSARWYSRLTGVVVVAALVLAVTTPLGIGSKYALVQRSVIEQVFARADNQHVSPERAAAAASSSTASPSTPPGTSPSASPGANAVAHASQPDAWAGRDRVNILLLGGDGGPDRVGVRTDTVIVASIDTRTGNTVLFSLPRNLQKVPFQPGSVLANAYPDGVFAGRGDQLEWMLTAIYENVPAQHPRLFTTDNPGAEAMKMAAAGALGIPIDYYMLVNLRGFEQLIDALGGIIVNINYPVAIGGEADAGLKPHGWLKKGPDQHLDGFNALWFARGRYGASDWDRMERQRCVIKAIIYQADPFTVLTRYEALARSSKDILYTDIPASVLPAFVDLALKIKDTGSLTSIVFTRKVIKTSNPDYPLIHSMVQNALIAKPDSTGSDFTDPLEDACAYKP